ncbi:MAG: mechanosensitive ion channel family protein [Planctomycetota bacterium]
MQDAGGEGQGLMATLDASFGGWGDALALFGVVALGVALIHTLIFLFAGRPKRGRTPGPADGLLKRRTRVRSLVFLLLVGAIVALGWTPLEGDDRELVLSVLRAGMIAVLTWTIIGAVSVIDEIVFAKYDVSVADNLRARRMHTRARVLVRTAEMVIAVAGVAGVLMSFESVRQVGQGLLASAGVAGLAVGFAARPVLGNLIAGLQIAITEPIRLDDAVIIEGEWGWIEEITATYVVVKIWDERRLVVPLSQVIEQPFQNWTRRTAQIIGSVTLHLDYSADVDALREELQRLCEANPRWDKRVCVLQVIETTDRVMVLRALVSSGTSPACWDLRCEIREGLIDFVKREQPGALPRLRTETPVGD